MDLEFGFIDATWGVIICKIVYNTMTMPTLDL